MEKIGFIGVGVMGKSMVRNLKKCWLLCFLFIPVPKINVVDLIEEGIDWQDTIKDCIHDKDIIMTMVGYPSDVEAVYYGEDGI